MPPASTSTSTSINPHSHPNSVANPSSIKIEPKNLNNYSKASIPRLSSIDSDMPDLTGSSTGNVHAASSGTSSAILIDGSEEDSLLARSEFLTREEVLKRRSRRIKQLSRIYRDHYWILMEELKLKYREYYWEYGKSPFQEENGEDNNSNSNRRDASGTTENNNNSNFAMNNGTIGNNRCGVHGCKSKAMALTRFCHMHILSDAKQKLYKACNYAVKSSPTGPILCGKAILRSTVPSYCSAHFQKAEKHVARALKKAGLNVSSTSKLAPKFHVIVAEYVRQIQSKRKAAQKASLEIVEVKEDNSS